MLDLRRSITFKTRVSAAAWVEDHALWRISLDDRRMVTARYFITATGIFSSGNIPDFPGDDSFRDETCFSGKWPHIPVDFTGKRVGIIGTGATAIQIIPNVAEQTQLLTVFQRRPNYAGPLQNHKLTPEQMAQTKVTCREIRRRAFASDCMDGIPGKAPLPSTSRAGGAL